MNGFLEDHKAYGHTLMKERLKEYFGDQIIIADTNWKSNVVTLRSTAECVLQELHDRQEDYPDMEKIHLIKKAAKLIRNDIKSVGTSKEHYPPSCEIESQEKSYNFLPIYVNVFLEGIIMGKDVNLKRASIGQVIWQAARPRVLLAPLQIGLDVQLHHHFASRLLIDWLHRLGFCCSYQEVQTFGKNAAVTQGTGIPNHTSEFVQYVADNVDHNLRTLDGNDTFHGMGLIATVTPGAKQTQVILRRKVNPTEVSVCGQI